MARRFHRGHLRGVHGGRGGRREDGAGAPGHRRRPLGHRGETGDGRRDMEGDGSKVVKLGLHEAGGSSLCVTLLYPLVLLLLEVVKRSLWANGEHSLGKVGQVRLGEGFFHAPFSVPGPSCWSCEGHQSLGSR